MHGYASNAEAAAETVKRLDEAGTLDEIEPAIVQAFLSLAAAVDDPDAKADLWREYRAATAALREAAAGGSDDDTASFLVSIQTPRSRAKMGDPEES
jgi:hypothetical protein